MKKMFIYEPAMCCSTGLCGVGVDPELLRVSTVLASLQKNGIEVERYNLTNAPQEFVKNVKVNLLLKEEGVDVLPVTVVDGEVVKTKKYPTNEEFLKFFNVPKSFISEQPKVYKVTAKKTGGCDCKGGCC